MQLYLNRDLNSFQCTPRRDCVSWYAGSGFSSRSPFCFFCFVAIRLPAWRGGGERSGVRWSGGGVKARGRGRGRWLAEVFVRFCGCYLAGCMVLSAVAALVFVVVCIP